MTTEEILAEKREIIWKACNHQETEYIPNVAHCGNAALVYAGMTYFDVENNEEKIEYVLSNILKSVRLDVGMFNLSGSPRAYKALDERPETFLTPDGIGLQHLQQPKMREDEYPQLIENMDLFMKETLLPRKYPELFVDKKRAVEKLKIVVEEMVDRAEIYAKVAARVFAEYGFQHFPGGLPRFTLPADFIFDRFRGFEGTLTDLRRRPAEFKKAIDMIYEKRSDKFDNIKVTNAFASYMAHIPCYLNREQYNTFFFPYFREMLENIVKSGNKLFINMEGRWMPFVDTFLELPKDSLVIIVDDDDIFELNKRIGHHQVLTGGVKVQNIRLLSREENLDYAKRVIDECAPGGGFMFNTDKMWLYEGDINQTLFDVYNFAHEYGKK